jgi:glycosidase
VGEHPGIYEVNTWVWLDELSARYGEPVTLGSVPEADWDELVPPGTDAVWLMGVWELSPTGAKIAQREPWLVDFAKSYLPDFTLDDIVGSPYSVRRYVPDERLGGFAGLDVARERLRSRGLALILDYVPNHLARDHPWVTEHPEYFLRGGQPDMDAHPGEYVRIGSAIFALGRDPYFPAWTDVVQVDAFHPGLREATVDTLADVGDHCDGVRCDMAMLLLNDVFARTWGERAGVPPTDDFWPSVIPAVRARHPSMTFVAEAYWDLEGRLLEQGFDYCYDKRLYDRLLERNPEAVRAHLRADLSYQRRLVRFLENHDEPRASAMLSGAEVRAAALAVSTLPGAILYHQGQLVGKKVRVPVAVRRTPPESDDKELADFYAQVIRTGRDVRRGDWRLSEVRPVGGDATARNILAWSWEADDRVHLVAVNLSGSAAQSWVDMPPGALRTPVVRLADLFSGLVVEHEADDLAHQGLYVSLDGHGFHVLHTT